MTRLEASNVRWSSCRKVKQNNRYTKAPLDSGIRHPYSPPVSVGAKMMTLPRLPLIIPVAALALLQRSAPAQTAASACPTSPHVIGYPAGGPRGNNDWYANADRTIWATFWGWDFVGHGPNEPYPRTGYVATPKVLWYKPSEYSLTVIGHRLDGGLLGTGC